METITIKTMRTMESEKTMTIPYFCQTTSNSVICVTGVDTAIRACIFPISGGASVEIENPKYMSLDLATEISEDEFFKVYNQAQEAIKGGLL